MDGTHGSGIVSCAAGMVRGMRGVGGVCEMCMCLAWGSRGRECGEWIGFGLYQSCGNKGTVGCVSLFGLRLCRWGCGGVMSGFFV